MSKNERSNRDPSPTEPPRTRRARTESMSISLRRTGGLYEVRVASGRIYDVDVSMPACTCPDWQTRQPAGGCKHLRRVDMEIKARTVPGPDGRVVRNEAPRPDDVEPGDSSSAFITGPPTEYGPHGEPTGHVYYRCSRCSCEALQRENVHRTVSCGKPALSAEKRRSLPR